MPLVGGTPDEKKPPMVEVIPRSLQLTRGNDHNLKMTHKNAFNVFFVMYNVIMKVDCCLYYFTIVMCRI